MLPITYHCINHTQVKLGKTIQVSICSVIIVEWRSNDDMYTYSYHRGIVCKLCPPYNDALFHLQITAHCTYSEANSI